MRLPALAREDLPRAPPALLAALARVGTEPAYVHARAGPAELFLFVRDGRAWCAGANEGGSLGALSVSAFVARVDTFDEAALCRCDLPLFLCTAVLFRKPPAAHIPAALVDGESLLKSVRALGKDAVLAVQRKDAWALAFCRSGEPAALYAAPELGVGTSGTPQDRLMELVYTAPGEVVIDVYDEIRLPPASDAGQTLAALTQPLAPDAPRPTLVVLLGDRVVFRHRLDKAQTLVGRGLEADLALDNLSVSRRHAVVHADGDKLVVEDQGSENGLEIYGTKVARAELKPGDRVGIGKYALLYAMQAGPAETPPPRRRSTSADIETITVNPPGTVALEHGGRRHAVKSAVYTIGSGQDAHLRIKGLFVADVHAALQIDGDGYKIERMGGARALKVNGAPVDRIRLKDGDEIQIAGEKIVFRSGR